VRQEEEEEEEEERKAKNKTKQNDDTRHKQTDADTQTSQYTHTHTHTHTHTQKEDPQTNTWIGPTHRKCPRIMKPTISNSSSRSLYMMFSSSSLKSGAYALQFSAWLLPQIYTTPEVEHDAITGRVGCHCEEEEEINTREEETPINYQWEHACGMGEYTLWTP
jgi:hypothetical protein